MNEKIQNIEGITEAEVQLIASAAAEKARNEALAVLSVLALIGGLGIYASLNSQISEMANARYVEEAKVNLTLIEENVQKSKTLIGDFGQRVPHEVSRSEIWGSERLKTAGHICDDGSMMVGLEVTYDSVDGRIRTPIGMKIVCETRVAN